jgi:hypothetical protein
MAVAAVSNMSAFSMSGIPFDWYADAELVEPRSRSRAGLPSLWFREVPEEKSHEDLGAAINDSICDIGFPMYLARRLDTFSCCKTFLTKHQWSESSKFQKSNKSLENA